MKSLLPIILMMPLSVYAAGHGNHDEENIADKLKKEHAGKAAEHGGKAAKQKEHGGKAMKEHGGKAMKEHGGDAAKKREHAGQPVR